MNATESAPATAGRLPRILVVDDERSMRELLAIVLRREGYDVLLAESGRAAIDTLEREPVDLLISDIKMPDLSGVDVLRAASSLPVPDSPVTSTVLVVCAIVSISSNTASIDSLRPMMLENWWRSPRARLSSTFSRRSRRRSSAPSTTIFSSSTLNGLWM